MTVHRLNRIAAAVLLLACLASAAEARLWKPGGADAAREYVIIEHSISENEFVFIYWLAREVVGVVAEDPAFQEFFSSYVMVGVGHVTISATGTFGFKAPEGVLLAVENQVDRAPLAKDNLPPLVAAVEEGVGSVLAAGMGQFGAAVEWFFFEAGGLDSCEPGRFWIAYGEERYEYVTPIPGCPEAAAE